MVKEKYIKLSKTYNLPNFELLNNLFEISTIENTDFLLREIKEKINGRLEYFINILEGILSPDASYISQMNECNEFSDSEKSKLYSFYKTLMLISRKSMEISVYNKEEEIAKFINTVYSQWPDILEVMKSVIIKIKNTWVNKTKKKLNPGYFG